MAILMLVALYIAAVFNATASVPQDVCLAVLAPFPDETVGLGPSFHPGWDGGPALIPAARLAADRINNRTDVLAGYRLRLLEGDSGCNVEAKSALSVAVNVFEQLNCSVVGIIGPACTGATTFVGDIGARDEVSLLQISPSATSPILISSDYTNTFRILSSSRQHVGAFLRLMEHNGWEDVAALYDADRKYFLSTFEHFQSVSSHIGYYSPVGNNAIPLDDIWARYRVVFVFVGASLARRILCLAYHFQPSLIYPIHQWIFHDKTADQFLKDFSFSYRNKLYRCSKQQMEIATEGIILNIYRLKRMDVTTETDVDLTYEQFSSTYPMYLTDYLRDVNLTKEDYNQNGEDFATVYYDATWAMALSLNHSLHDLANLNITLSNYSYGQPSATAVIKTHLSSLKFEGLSGRIAFQNSTRDPITIIDSYQLHYNRSSSSIHIGYYNNSILNTAGKGKFVSGTFEIVVVSIHPAVSTIFFLLPLLIFVYAAILHILYIYARKSRAIKASSPTLSHLIFSGCYLLLLRSVLKTMAACEWMNLTPRQHMIVVGVLCNVTVWCETIGYSLILDTLFVQIWRIYHIFNHFKMKHFFLSDEYLAGYVVCLLVLNLTVLLTWTISDPLLAELEIQEVEYSQSQEPVIPVRSFCNSKNDSIYYSIPWCVNFLISVGLIVFSTLNRHITRLHFNTTVQVNKVVYIGNGLAVLCTVIGFTVWRNNIHYSFILWQVSFLSVVLLVCTFIFLPRIWRSTHRVQSKHHLRKTSVCL